MLLYKALQRADCPICLLPLRKRRRAREEEDSASPARGGFRITHRDDPPHPSGGPDDLMSRGIEKEDGHFSAAAAEEEGVVVLRCGHFMHVRCAAQFFEFSSAKKTCVCPICRAAVERGAWADGVVRFGPRTRPLKVRGEASAAASEVEVEPAEGTSLEVFSPSDNTRASSEGEEEAVIVGCGQVAPSTVYADQLTRSSNHYKARMGNLAGRARHLQGSLRQLQEDCAALERAVSTLRRQQEALAGKAADEQRLAELRRLSSEAKRSCDNLTMELAASTREEQTLRQQIDKYKRKLKRLS